MDLMIERFPLESQFVTRSARKGCLEGLLCLRAHVRAPGPLAGDIASRALWIAARDLYLARRRAWFSLRR